MNVWPGRLRILSVWLLVALLVTLSRPTVAGVAGGAALMAAGEAIRLWASGHLRKNVELITSGPYRFTRNPLYLGRLLIFSGLCLMARLPWGLHWAVLAAGGAIFFGVYLRRKERVEPERLSRLHGDAYDRYRRSVPALFPTWRPYPEGVSPGWSSERMARNREHWMLLVVAALTLFMLWRANSLGG